MTNEIDSLASYLKDSNTATQSALVAEVCRAVQAVNAHAEPAATIADNLSDSCQANGERTVPDESVIFNHDLATQADLDRVSTPIIHSDNARPKHRSDEDRQNKEPLMQSLSLICDDILAAEKKP